MANIEISNNDTAGIIVQNPYYVDAILKTGEVGVFPAGTLMNRVTASDDDIKAYEVDDELPTGSGPDLPLTDAGRPPVGIITEEVNQDGTADIRVRLLVRGIVRKSDLTIWNGGSPVSVFTGALDMLAAAGVLAVETLQLAKLGNQ